MARPAIPSSDHCFHKLASTMAESTPTFGAGCTGAVPVVPPPPPHHRKFKDQYDLVSKVPAWVFAMSIGIQQHAGVLDKDPFKDAPAKNKKKFRLTASILRDEVVRRSFYLQREKPADIVFKETRGLPPKPRQWKMDRLVNWLEDPDHVIATGEDCIFVTTFIEMYSKKLTEVIKLAQDLQETAEGSCYWNRRNFSGLSHRVRLLEIMLDDEHRELFLLRDDCKNRSWSM